MPARSPVIGDLKLCRPCATWKIVTEFPKDARIKSGLASKCKSCNREDAKKHRADNPGRHAAQTAAWRELNPEYGRIYYEENIDRLRKAGIASNRRRTYGVSGEQYEHMLKLQNYVCALCKEPETARYVDGRIKSLAVDHCHASGKVRKLLCQLCNTGLGNFKDDVELLKEAIKYLEENK